MPVFGSHGAGCGPGQQFGSPSMQPHDIGSIMHGSLQVDGSFGSGHGEGHAPVESGFVHAQLAPVVGSHSGGVQLPLGS